MFPSRPRADSHLGSILNPKFEICLEGIIKYFMDAPAAENEGPPRNSAAGLNALVVGFLKGSGIPIALRFVVVCLVSARRYGLVVVTIQQQHSCLLLLLFWGLHSHSLSPGRLSKMARRTELIFVLASLTVMALSCAIRTLIKAPSMHVDIVV
jgi:hypothetical protein